MNTITDKLADALSALLSLNRTQGVTEEQYEAAEYAGDMALAEYDARPEANPAFAAIVRVGAEMDRNGATPLVQQPEAFFVSWHFDAAYAETPENAAREALTAFRDGAATFHVRDRNGRTTVVDLSQD